MSTRGTAEGAKTQCRRLLEMKASTRALLPQILKTALLLCMLALRGSQGSHVRRNQHEVQSLLYRGCWEIASFLPSMCRVDELGPACCGLSAIVAFCSPSCVPGPAASSLEALMYDVNVCDALKLTAHVHCRGGPEGFSPRCQRLRHLIDVICIPYYSYRHNEPFYGDNRGRVSDDRYTKPYYGESRGRDSDDRYYKAHYPDNTERSYDDRRHEPRNGENRRIGDRRNVGGNGEDILTGVNDRRNVGGNGEDILTGLNDRRNVGGNGEDILTGLNDRRNVGGNGEDILTGVNAPRTSTLLTSCVAFPEVANSEMTGLVDDRQCEQPEFQYDTVEPECQEGKKLRYRTIDGSCNNLQNPRWGKSFEPQKRLLPAQLVDGNLPRNETKNGNPLPPPRVISRGVTHVLRAFADVSNMVMAWGQFIDHDFTGTPVIKNGTQNIKCCGDIAEELKLEHGGPCFPIAIPKGDPLGRDCMQFVRSMAFTFPNKTQLIPREQINSLTAFLDGSATYGNTQEQLDKLRGENGKLNVTENNMLPENPTGTCKKVHKGDYCLLAGDTRVNVFVGLMALHAAFVREHNRIVDFFVALNPDWDDEKLFQEARRIVSAQFQHVTYTEWLPLVLSDATLDYFRLHEGDFKYDPEVDPTIANVFSTAAFRFGHSQVKQEVKIGNEFLNIQDILMRPQFAFTNMSDIVRGLVDEPTDKVDCGFVDGLTNHMFETNSTAMDGLDLVSLNIQRGRDHGLPPFNDWREYCELPRIRDLSSPELTISFKGIYDDADDIDLFPGMMAETLVPGSLVGSTLNCLLGLQFHAMKFGDRFFYETRSPTESFTEAQLEEIKKVRLAKILCDNNPDLEEIQEDVFKMADPRRNPVTLCADLPGMNLTQWAEGLDGTGS